MAVVDALGHCACLGCEQVGVNPTPILFLDWFNAKKVVTNQCVLVCGVCQSSPGPHGDAKSTFTTGAWCSSPCHKSRRRFNRHLRTGPVDRLTMCVAFAGSSLQAIGRVQRAHVGFVTEPDGFAVRIHVAGKVNVPHGDESHLGRRAQFLQRLASPGIYCNAIQH